MKTHYKPSLSACLAFALRRLALCLVLLSTISFSLSTFGQSTAFTYSGRLNDGGYPANGSYDLRFALFDAATSGTQQGSSRTNFTTGVTNGLVTVTLDFGATVFNGGDRWLELGVRTNGATVFTTLTPRQQLLRTPYAITAQNVVSNGLASGIYGNAVTFNNAANNFSGDFAGDGANVSNVNATSLGGLAASSFWNTAGNAGTTAGAQFLGTTDFQPLEFKVNGTRALRLIPNLYGGPSVVGGAPVNIIYPGTTGSTISGGGASDLHGASYTNSVFSDFGTIGGGFANTIQNSANDSTMAADSPTRFRVLVAAGPLAAAKEISARD